MATFKVGDKARIAHITWQPHVQYNGREVIVTGPQTDWFGIAAYPVEPIAWQWPVCCSNAVAVEFLVPLSDPKADAFIERIRNMKPYEEPTAPKVRPTITMLWTPLPPPQKTYIDDDYIVRFGERPPREKTFSEHFADVWHSLTGR